jgi:hypothetical protein
MSSLSKDYYDLHLTTDEIVNTMNNSGQPFRPVLIDGNIVLFMFHKPHIVGCGFCGLYPISMGGWYQHLQACKKHKKFSKSDKPKKEKPIVSDIKDNVFRF